MGVYIKGMKMPKHCGECAVEWCNRWKQLIIAGMSIAKSRPSDCPLIEIPPHGRLIDERWLKDAMITTLEALKKNPKMDRQEMHLIAAFDTLRCMVEDAPTIIDEERE